MTCCSLSQSRVRLPAGQLLLDLGVGDDALLDRIHQEHAAGLQAALLANILGRHVDHAGLGGQHDQIVLGDDVAAGAQAVAVQRGADHAAVGEGDGRRSVPRLHQRGVVLVEGALVFVHVGIARPGLGNQHGHHVGQGTARLEEKLHGVVERSRVAAAGHDHREELVDLSPCSGLSSTDWRAFIQLTLPRMVLISPLCAT